MTRRIQNVAPLLTDIFMNVETDHTALSAYHKMVSNNYARLGLFYKYSCRLHDSRVLAYNLARKSFSVTLNEFTTHVFADSVVNRKRVKINHEKLIFPLRINFEIKDLTFNTVDDEGVLTKIEPVAIDEYQYEEIISIDDKEIEIGLVFLKNKKKSPSQQILILLSAVNILVTELQEEAWTAIFRGKYSDYYRYFKFQFEKGRHLSGCTECNELVDEYDSISG